MQSASPSQCDVQELKTMLQQVPAPCLVDVREKWELDICQLPGAAHIPLSSLAQRLEELPRDRDIVVFCHHGVRSLKAAGLMKMAGWDRAISLRGGIHAWAEQIDPAMKKY